MTDTTTAPAPTLPPSTLTSIGTMLATKGLSVLAGIAVTHGLMTSSNTETFISGGLLVVSLLWSEGYRRYVEFGRPIILAQLEVLKAKSMAQAAALKAANLPKVTVAQIAAQSPTMEAPDVVKAIATLPPEIRENVALPPTPAAPAAQSSSRTQAPPLALVAVALAFGALALGLASPAAAEQPTQRRQAPVEATKPAPAPVDGILPIKATYAPGAPLVLKIPNPLGLPDPLCVTDHPSASCVPAGSAPGTTPSNITMTGDPYKDLAALLQKGGNAFIRDMARADEIASFPTVASCTTDCTKTDAIGSSCLEALVPLAQLVVNGPPATTAQPAGLPTFDTPLVAADEALVSTGEKARIVLIALQGNSIKQGCGALVLDTVQQAQNLASGIITFITTLGVVG